MLVSIRGAGSGEMQDLHWHGSSCVGSFATLGGRVLMLPAPAGCSETWPSTVGPSRPVPLAWDRGWATGAGGSLTASANFRGHGLEKKVCHAQQLLKAAVWRGGGRADNCALLLITAPFSLSHPRRATFSPMDPTAAPSAARASRENNS